ncbi:hypothetical protein [Photobacterium leiognathi]|uniref:hypothetical protein n=1 Tax=Photobacterium leiognathi TaxID=553611 RepID=UPI0029814AE9|nr:hypothetical protein [Photobacterium leiognathi]
MLKLLAVFTLLALAGCDDDAVNNESNGSGNGNGNGDIINPAPKSCMSLITDEYQCLPDKVIGRSGQRIHIPLTGNIKEGMSFNWATTEVEGITTPIFMSDKNGAYVILPRTTNDTTLTLNVEGKLGSVHDSASIPIDVTGAETLILNGINLISMNTDGLVVTEWLPAVNAQGDYANDVLYSLNVTKLVDGKPSNDSRTFQTANLSESIDVEFGALYRFVLSAEDDKGNVTYSEHIDYLVSEQQPELQDIITNTTKKMPDPASLELYSLVDDNGALKIVRETKNGDHYYDNAMAHEIYKVTAPLKVTMRLKELEPEEITAHFQRQAKQYNDDTNSFSIIPPTSQDNAKNKIHNIEKLCKKLEFNQPIFDTFEGSMCTSPSKSLICTNDYTLSPKLTAKAECTLNNNFEVKLESKSKFELNQLYVYWPGTNMIKKIGGNKYFEAIELGLGTRIGAKLDIKYPLKIAIGFKSNASVTGNVSFKMGNWLPALNIDVSSNSKDIFKPLSNSWQEILEFPNYSRPAEMGLELKLGVFPRISIGENLNIEAEAAGKLALKNKFQLIKPVGQINAPAINVMPLFTTVDGAIDANGVGSASVDLSKVFPSLSEHFKGTVETETPSLNLYTHPKKVTFDIEQQYACSGKYTYHNDTPILTQTAFGPLNKGDSYGNGWWRDEVITVPNKGDIALKSFNIYGPGAKLMDAGYNGSSIGITYTDIMNKQVQEATLLYEFIKPGSLLQKAFPIYAVDKYKINGGVDTSQAPWVCWGNGYRTVKKSESITLTLQEAANLSVL